MNSGLTAEASSEFIVSWTDMEYEPNAEISIDEETLTASIRPYCENENGILIENKYDKEIENLKKKYINYLIIIVQINGKEYLVLDIKTDMLKMKI